MVNDGSPFATCAAKRSVKLAVKKERMKRERETEMKGRRKRGENQLSITGKLRLRLRFIQIWHA